MGVWRCLREHKRSKQLTFFISQTIKQTMKKILPFILTFLSTIASAQLVEISGYCGKDGENIRWTYYSEEGTLLLEGTGEMASCNSEQPWRKYVETINTVKVGEGITNISEFAFQNVKATVVSLPSTLKVIDNCAFRYCTKIEKIEIPDGVMSIGYSAFDYCTLLEEIVLSAELTEIGHDAFRQTAIKEIEIPSQVENLGDRAFYCCQELSEVKLSEGIEKIGNNCFHNCTKLSKVNMPESLLNIGGSAFCSTALENVELLNVQAIGSRAFAYCSNLKSFTLPNEFTDNNIMENVFEGCSSLSEVKNASTIFHVSANGNESYTVPVGITTIAKYCFYNSSLKKITFSSSVTSVGNYAFASSNIEEFDMTSVEYLSLGEGVFSNSAVTRIISSEKIANCSRSAFLGCKNLQELDLSGIKKLPDIYYVGNLGLGDNALSGCDNLKSIVMPHAVGRLDIGKETFKDCTSLESFDFSSVGTIGMNAFEGCTSLKTIELSDFGSDQTGAYIYYGAFSGCTELESVVIGSSGIGQLPLSAFKGCTNLNSVTINSENIPVIVDLNQSPYNGLWDGDFSKYNLPYDKVTFTMYGYLVDICLNGSDRQFWTKVKFERVYEELSGTCGAEGNNLTWTLNTKDGIFKVTGNGDMTDYVSGVSKPWGNRRLSIKGLEVEDEVGSIGAYAFIGCSHLTNVKAKGLRKIGEFAFAETGLTTFDFYEGLIETGTGVFRGCTSLKAAVLPQSLQTIGEGLFSGCTTINRVELPKGIAYLPNYTFVNCNNLKEIFVPASQPPSPVSGRSYSYTFSGVNVNSTTIYVPEGSAELYRNSTLWGRFGNMKDYYAHVEIETNDGGSFIIGEGNSQRGHFNDYLVLGQPFNMKAAADDYYSLKSMLINDSESLSEHQDGLLNIPSLSRSMKVQLTFEPNEYMLTLFTHGRGHISVLGYDITDKAVFKVKHNEKIEVNFITDEDFSLKSVMCNDVDVINDLQENRLTIDHPTHDYIVEAYFTFPIIPGDVDGNDIVNSVDIVEMMNYISGRQPKFFIEEAADVNNDGIVNIADIVNIVNTIIGK